MYIVLGMVFFTSVSCLSLSLRDQEIIRGEEGHYLINPDTILADIAQGKTDIFMVQSVTPEPPLSTSLSVVQWNQADYLEIARALHQFVWNESIEDWNLRHLLFSMKCEDILNGPQFGYFIFYKVASIREEESLFEHQIYIDPSNNSVSWSEVEYYPNLARQSAIELLQNKLTVTDALQIAESNGGEETRMGVDNNCKVRGELFNSHDNWRVSYVKVLDLFVIEIDALTGEYKIVNTEKR
jgi:hypothetical protein